MDDTLKALGDLAAHWIEKVDPFILAITGSGGKTTTKEILFSILNRLAKTLKSEGNFNNLIGLPLTAFRLRDERRAVFEMGMSAPGEIARLAEIANPRVGVITNVLPAHLESMGTVDNVAHAKGELFEALGENDWAVVNLDNPYTVKLSEKLYSKRITFSLFDKNADVFAGRFEMKGEKTSVDVAIDEKIIEVDLPLLGRRNVENMLAAMAAAFAAGISPEDMPSGIAATTIPGPRMKKRIIGDYLVLDDSYNANPVSMAAALDLLSELSGGRRKVAVLGDMLEMGKESGSFHEDLGRHTVEAGIGLLLAYGGHASDIANGAMGAGMPEESTYHTYEFNDIRCWLGSELKSGDAILIKGSRGMRLERAVDEINRLCGEGPAKIKADD